MLYNNQKSIEEFLAEKGLSVTDPEYNKKKEELEIIKSINDIYGVKEKDEFGIDNQMYSPNQLGPGAIMLYNHYKNNPENAKDLFYNENYGLMNNYINDKDNSSSGYFQAILNSDKKKLGSTVHDYEHSQEHYDLLKKIEKADSWVQDLKNGKGGYQMNPALFKQAVEERDKLREIDNVRKIQYEDEETLNKLTKKYTMILDADKQLKDGMVNNLIEVFKEHDRRFQDFLSPEYNSNEESRKKAEDILRRNIESILPEYYARMTLDNTERQEKANLWFGNRLQDNLNEIQSGGEMFINSLFEQRDIFAEMALYTAGVFEAAFGNFEYDENGNLIITNTDPISGQEYTDRVNNTFLQRFLHSKTVKKANEIQETGYYDSEKAKEARKQGYKKNAIYNVGTDRGLVDQLYGAATLAESSAQTAFTVSTAAIGGLASTVARKLTGLATKGVATAMLTTNKTTFQVLNTMRTMRKASDILSYFVYGGVSGTMEGFQNANETYINSLTSDMKKYNEFSGGLFLDGNTSYDDIKNTTLYKENLKRLKEEQAEQNSKAQNVEGNTLTIDLDSPYIEEKAVMQTITQLNNLVNAADEFAASAAKSDFILNSATNGLINSFFKTGFQIPAVKRAVNSSKIGSALNDWGKRTELTIENGKSVAKTYYTIPAKIARPLKTVIAEGGEEGIQNVYDHAMVAKNDYAFDRYLENQIWGNGQGLLEEYLSDASAAAWEAAGEALKSTETWKEAAMGSLGTLMPTFGLGLGRNTGRLNRSENENAISYLYKVSPIKSTIVDEAISMNKEMEIENKRLNTIANFFNSKEFKTKMNAMGFALSSNQNSEEDGYDQDEKNLNYLSKVAVMLDVIKNTEYGKTVNEYFDRLASTDFNTNNEEGIKFVKGVVNEMRLLDESLKDKTDEEIYNERKQFAENLLEIKDKAKESSDYVNSLFGEGIDPFLKDYIAHTHLELTMLGENKNNVDKQIVNILSEIDDLHLNEDDGKIHFSDLSEKNKQNYIKYGSNIDIVQKEWEGASDLLRTRRKLDQAVKEGRISKFMAERQFKKFEEELDALQDYKNFLEKNKDKLDLFIDVSEIRNLDPVLRSEFLSKKDERINKFKYGNKQNKILNNIGKKVGDKISERIQNGDKISSKWFKDALEYSKKANVFAKSAVASISEILVNPDKYMNVVMDESAERGRINGEAQGKLKEFDSGTELYKAVEGINQKIKVLSRDLRSVDNIMEIERLKAYRDALINKNLHKNTKAIEEYDKIAKNERTYMDAKNKLGSVGYAADDEDRKVTHSMFRFLILNNIDINDLDKCIEFLNKNREKYEKYVEEYNKENDDKIPVYSWEDEYERQVDETEGDEVITKQNEGLLTVFKTEFYAIKKYNENIESIKDSVDKNENKPNEKPTPKPEAKSKPEAPKERRSDFQILFGNAEYKYIEQLKDDDDKDIKLSDDEFKQIEYFVVENKIKTFDELVKKLKKSEFQDIYNKLKKAQEREKQREENTRIEQKFDNLSFQPGRTLGLPSENMSVDDDIYASENISWLEKNIEKIKNDKTKEHYKKVLNFYKNEIIPNISTITKLNIGETVYVYKNADGLYIILCKLDSGTYNVNGENYIPLSVMPYETDITQQGVQSFNKLKNSDEVGFISDNDGNPLEFSLNQVITNKIEGSSIEEIDANDYINSQQSDSELINEAEKISLLNKLFVDRTDAHKNLAYNDGERTLYIRVKSVFDAKTTIGNGEEQSVISVFKDENPSIDYINAVSKNKLFNGVFWAIEDAVTGLNDSNQKEKAETLKSRMESFFWLSSGREYVFYYEDDENKNNQLVLAIKEINKKGQERTVAKAFVSPNDSGVFDYENIKRSTYEFLRNCLYDTNGKEIKNEYGNSGLVIQLNYSSTERLQEELKDVNNNPDNWDEKKDIGSIINYNRFFYLLDNGFLFIKQQRDVSRNLQGIKIERKISENKQLDIDNTRSLISKENTIDQNNILERIINIQKDKRIKKNKASKNANHKTVTGIVYGDKGEKDDFENPITNVGNRIVGNEIDTIARDLFANKIYYNKDYNKDRDKNSNKYYIVKKGEDIDVVNYYGLPGNILNIVIDSLMEIKNSFAKTIFVTDSLYLFDEIDVDGELQNVSADLDMIGVTPEGDVILFDFKTGGTSAEENFEKWSKQTELYKKLLAKAGINVNSRKIIHIKNDLDKTVKNSLQMSVEDLMQSDRGRKILKNRFNVDVDNMTQEDIQKLKLDINMLGYSSGSFVEIPNSEFNDAVIVDLEKPEIKKEAKEQTQNQDACGKGVVTNNSTSNVKKGFIPGKTPSFNNIK